MINGNTRVLGVIGNPVRHTKSPAIHNYISEKLSKNMVYVPFEVTKDVVTAVKGAYELGILGMNVTVPYKGDVIEALCDIDDMAKRIGAVNTLVYTDKGYKGYNTDMLGLERAVVSEGINMEGMSAVLLGAGGAARAVAFMCARNSVKDLYILNRTVSKAQDIISDVKKYAEETGIQINLKAMAIDEYTSITEKDLLVFQCTKIGLAEEDGAVIEDINFYKKIKYGVDLIYRDNTKFQMLVKEAGGESYTGLKMLLYQGVIAYELWNALSVPEDVVNGAMEVLKGE